MKRIISLALMLVITLLSLTSCARISALNELRDVYPAEEQAYTVASEMEIKIDDETILSLYPALAGRVKTTYTVNGENKRTVIETPYEGRVMVTEQTLVGKTYYIKASLTTAGTALETRRYRVLLDDEQREELFAGERSTTTAGFGIGDFGKVKREKTDDGIIYTLAEFKDGSVSGLEDLVRGIMNAEDAEVTTLKMDMIITLVNGLVATETIDCEFLVRDGNIEFNIPMTMVNTYSTDVEEITDPVNASHYEIVPYYAIFGME